MERKNITNKELYALAREARERSYCPYSGYSVGAALLCADGKIYLGANIENASFSPTVCAERVAFFNAINDGQREFVSIAVAGGKKGEAPMENFPPCGVCRQVMREFCKDDFVIVINEDVAMTLSELLPSGFTL